VLQTLEFRKSEKLPECFTVSNLGSLNPKCPRNPIAMAAAQYIHKCGQRRHAKLSQKA